MPKQNAGEVAIQSFGILMNFCTFVKLTFFVPRTSLRQKPLRLIARRTYTIGFQIEFRIVRRIVTVLRHWKQNLRKA